METWHFVPELPHPSFDALSLLGPATLEEEGDDHVFGLTARDGAGQSCRLTDWSWHLEPVDGSLAWRQHGSVVLHAGRAESGTRVVGRSTSWWLDIDATLEADPPDALDALVDWMTRPIAPAPIHLNWPSLSVLTHWMHDVRVSTSDRYMEVEDRNNLFGREITRDQLNDFRPGDVVPTDTPIQFVLTVGIEGNAVAEYLAVTYPNLIAGATAMALFHAVARDDVLTVVSHGAPQLWLLPDDGRLQPTWPYLGA